MSRHRHFDATPLAPANDNGASGASRAIVVDLPACVPVQAQEIALLEAHLADIIVALAANDNEPETG